MLQIVVVKQLERAGNGTVIEILIILWMPDKQISRFVSFPNKLCSNVWLWSLINLMMLKSQEGIEDPQVLHLKLG